MGDGVFTNHVVHVTPTEDECFLDTFMYIFTSGTDQLSIRFKGGATGNNDYIYITDVKIELCLGERVVTDAPTFSPHYYSPCTEDCGDGEGKVTGGGWILLEDTSDIYFDRSVCPPNSDCSSANLEGIKANYGFNAMFRKGIPEGSTNFDFDGGFFHFHSETQSTPLKFLEVIDGVHARWMGKGWLATTAKPRKNDWDSGFCFMVGVQDHGEPGYLDTWRIRIWRCDDTCFSDNPGDTHFKQADIPNAFTDCGNNIDNLVFDTNPTYLKPGDIAIPAIEDEASEMRFNGTQVGTPDSEAKGGGNIQIHLKTNGNNDKWCQCDCGDGEGKVTGGGWIYLDGSYFNTNYCGNSQPCNAYAAEGLTGVKANYGFNAMYRKGIPEGSTNFDFDGGYFHFHSATQGTNLKFLEVIDGIHARWMGRGYLASTLVPKKNDWDDDFCFMVAVQDHGEPGYHDTWRIRIWYCGQDNNGPNDQDCFADNIDDTPFFQQDIPNAFTNCGHMDTRLVFDTNPDMPLPGDVTPLPTTETVTTELRFNGTEVGEQEPGVDGAKGRGNIQIHLKTDAQWAESLSPMMMVVVVVFSPLRNPVPSQMQLGQVIHVLNLIRHVLGYLLIAVVLLLKHFVIAMKTLFGSAQFLGAQSVKKQMRFISLQ